MSVQLTLMILANKGLLLKKCLGNITERVKLMDGAKGEVDSGSHTTECFLRKCTLFSVNDNQTYR